MLGQKEGHGQAMAQKQQKQIYSGMTTNSWKEKNRSNDWQTNTDIGGYVKIPGESAWSQHSDSAASMFPLAPGWEEDYQDLSPYCRRSLQNMSSAKEDGTKSFSCIVQDDELNTPEICIQNFDYPTQGNVLSRDDTSPMSLFEGGMWDIPSPIVSRQTSINGKIQNIITSNEVLEHSKSDEKYLQTVTEVGSDQLKTDKEILSDEIPIVAHEEEIISTEDVIIEESVTCDMETNSILIYDKGTDCVQFVQSVDNLNEVTMIDPDMEDDLRDSDIEANLRKIESLLDDGTNLPSQDTNILKVIHDSYNTTDPVKMEIENSMSSDLDFSFENQEFNPLAFSNILYEDPKTDVQVNIKKEALNERKKFEIEQKNTESSMKNDAVQQQNVEKLQCRQKTDLSLNLAAILGAEDPISTPVILESLLGEEVPFRSLLDFIQSDGPEMKTEPIETASTVDFSEISSVSCNVNTGNTIPKNEITEEAPFNVMVVQPVVIKKSPNGKLSIAHKQVSDKQIKNEVGKKRGKQTFKKRFMKTSGKIKTFLNTNIENESEVSGDDEHVEGLTSTKQDSQKRRPRGRPPQEQSASSSKNDTTYPNRRRKTSCRSDFDDVNSPPSKRSRQSSVESESDKYRELRDRNNEASRKSRLSRKTREVEMKKSAEKLEKENQSLRIKAEEMERLVKKLREALLEAVTKAKDK